MPETTLQKFERESGIFSPVGVFIGCAVFTLLSWAVAERSVLAEHAVRFDRSAISLQEAYENRLGAYTNALTHIRNFVALQSALDGEKFGQFVKRMNLPKEYPGIQNIGYSRRLTPEQLRRSLAILPESTAGLLSQLKPTYDVIFYVENLFDEGTGARGMDLSVTEERRRAMNRAVFLGSPVATDRVQRLSVPSPDSLPFFLVFVPHFREGVPLETPEQRDRALLGFVYGSFRVPVLFGDALKTAKWGADSLLLRIYDGEVAAEEKLLFEQGPFDEASSQFEKVFSLDSAQHRWTMVLRGHRDFAPLSSRFLPLLVLGVGMILTVAVTLSALRARTYALKLKEDIRIRKETEARLAEEKRIVELTAKIGTDLKAEQDLESIVQMVTDLATDLTGAQFGAFFYNASWGEGSVMTLYSLRGAEREIFQNFRRTFETSELLRIDDLTQDPRAGRIGHLPVKSYLSAPVFSKAGKPLGSLVFGHAEAGVFSERSEAIVKSLAIQAAVAMDNAQLYRELSEARAAADAANRAKSIFLANVSHEIRTPLGVMLGFAELTFEQAGDREIVENHMRKIIRNGRELTRIVGEVLDLSKIEANKLVVEKSSFPVDEFLTDLVQEWRPQIESKGLRFEVERGPEVPSVISTDRTRLRQIVVNLLSNAVKFTEKGFIRLTLSKSPAHNWLSLDVWDSGIGISKDQEAKLFEAFSQGDESITRRFGGSGLGLALSKQIAQVLGGDLFLRRSLMGQGSHFSLILPYDVDLATESPVDLREPTAFARLRTLRVLLVEDSPDNQLLICTILDSFGTQVETADDGEAGVQKALAGGYDVILMDIQMPILDGYAAFQQLRRQGCATPVIALTAYALADEKKRALELGFRAYLTKPLDRQLLVQAILQVTVS